MTLPSHRHMAYHTQKVAWDVNFSLWQGRTIAMAAGGDPRNWSPWRIRKYADYLRGEIQTIYNHLHNVTNAAEAIRELTWHIDKLEKEAAKFEDT